MIHYIICKSSGSAKVSGHSLRSTQRDVLGFASLLVIIDSIKSAQQSAGARRDQLAKAMAIEVNLAGPANVLSQYFFSFIFII